MLLLVLADAGSPHPGNAAVLLLLLEIMMALKRTPGKTECRVRHQLTSFTAFTYALCCTR